MLKACILFSAACLFVIGCYVMFKPDLSDLGFIPVVATNPETASEFRSLFAGSFLAYAYLLLRFALHSARELSSQTFCKIRGETVQKCSPGGPPVENTRDLSLSQNNSIFMNKIQSCATVQNMSQIHDLACHTFCMVFSWTAS